MGSFSDAVFGNIDAKLEGHRPLPGSNVYGDSRYPGHAQTGHTAQQIAERRARALSAATCPDVPPYGSPNLPAALLDYGDWVTVRVGITAARFILSEGVAERSREVMQGTPEEDVMQAELEASPLHPREWALAKLGATK